jgi:pimeloyl-ACP methyl ester carboxylesterase
VHGELSPLMPAASAAEVARSLPQGQWTTLPQAYHNLMLDNPTGFVQIVQEFFADR